MITSTLRRMTTITKQDEWDTRYAPLLARLRPLLERQPGFVDHDLRREDDGGRMVETTRWRSADDCRAYLRNGGAAMAATILDAFFPTAPFPNGNWVRETSEAPD